VTDVIQQARKALAAFDAVFAAGTGEPRVGETVRGATSALRAVVDTAEDGHLIDTRRIVALGDCALEHTPVSARPWWVAVWTSSHGSHGYRRQRGASAAEALAAAERETSRGKTPDLMAALKASLGIPDTPEREAGL